MIQMSKVSVPGGVTSGNNILVIVEDHIGVDDSGAHSDACYVSINGVVRGGEVRLDKVPAFVKTGGVIDAYVYSSGAGAGSVKVNGTTAYTAPTSTYYKAYRYSWTVPVGVSEVYITVSEPYVSSKDASYGLVEIATK